MRPLQNLTNICWTNWCPINLPGIQNSNSCALHHEACPIRWLSSSRKRSSTGQHRDLERLRRDLPT